MRTCVISLLLWMMGLVSGGSLIVAQTSVNPDVSVIPRFRLETSDGEKLSQGKRVWSTPDFTFEELEIAFQAYLNPYSKAYLILTLPGPDLEAGKLGIEEVYVTVLRGLPLDLNIRLGKYRAEFGKINIVHPHAWPFLTQPIVEERFLGEEGLNDLGLSVSALLPTGDVYTRLTADLLRGTSIEHATGIPDTTGAKPTYAVTGRLSSFFSLDDESDLEVGLSGYTGIHDPYSRDRFWYGNVDVKYKYRPSAYTSLVVQGEYLFNSRTATQDRELVPFVNSRDDPEARSITSGGAYVYADYQFMKTFSVGARYDWSQTPYSSSDEAQAFAVFLGYYPVEETLGTRVQYQHTTLESSGGSQAVNAIALQVIFSLGPHKAHPF